TRARLVPGCPQGLRLGGRPVDAVALHLAMLLRVYERARDFDVIHCHTDYLGLPLARQSTRPTIVTLHGRLDLAELHPIYRAFPEVPLVSVSDAQRTPLAGVTWAATVHHGLPRDLFRFHPGPGRFLLFLGRIADGVPGFVCDTEEEMVAAVARLPTLRRAACREAFERRFTAARMADDYLRVFAARRSATTPLRAVAFADRPRVGQQGAEAD